MNIFDKIFGTHDAPPTSPALTYQTEGPVTANLTVIHGDVHIHTHDAPTILVTFSKVRGDTVLAPDGPGWGFDGARGVLRIDANAMPSRELKVSSIDVFLPADSSVTLNATGGDCTLVGRFTSLDPPPRAATSTRLMQSRSGVVSTARGRYRGRHRW